MMARMTPEAAFAVGRDKKKMVSLADQKLKPDVILIDDGYQRLDIEKDIDIVMVSPSIFDINVDGKPLRGICPFPGGVLRETFEALGRANAVFVITDDKDSEVMPETAIRRYNETAPVIEWNFTFSGVERDGEKESLDILKIKRPFLFAGIGSYSRLTGMIDKSGISLSGSYSFGDHHEYDKSDLTMLRDLSNANGADCYLTTAKDTVKFPSTLLDKPVYCLCLSVEPMELTRVNEIIGLSK
jgi:tetraacyldisaccharide 4'-kinase